MCVTTWLECKIAEGSGNAKIKRLNLGSVLEKLKSVKDKLIQWSVASDSWQPDVDWKEERASLLRRVGDWREALRSLSRHRTALIEITDSLKDKADIIKAEWRKHRDRIRAWTAGKRCASPCRRWRVTTFGRSQRKTPLPVSISCTRST